MSRLPVVLLWPILMPTPSCIDEGCWEKPVGDPDYCPCAVEGPDSPACRAEDAMVDGTDADLAPDDWTADSVGTGGDLGPDLPDVGAETGAEVFDAADKGDSGQTDSIGADSDEPDGPASDTSGDPCEGQTPGLSCDDGNACTTADICGGDGTCAGTPKACTDGLPCTADTCSMDTGECVHTQLDDGEACSDGNACTLGDFCAAGSCSAGFAATWVSVNVAEGSGLALLGVPGASVLAAGSVGTQEVDQHPWLARFDEAGVVAWQRSYDQDGGFVDIDPDGDGLILSGHARQADGTAKDGLVVSTNAFGTVAWEKTYGHSQEDLIRQLTVLDGGGYAFVGFGTPDEHPDLDGWVAKLDAQGVVVWEKHLHRTEHDQLRGILELPDGYFVVGEVTNQGKSDGWFVRLGPEGEVLWEKEFGGPGQDYFLDAALAPGQGFLLVGTTNEADDALSAWLMRTDLDGNVVWTKTFGTTGSSTATSVEALADGSIVFAGQHGESSQAWLVHTNSAGVLDWEQKYDPGTLATTFDVAPTDAGFFLTGSTFTADGPKPWFRRVDGGGAAVCDPF